MFLSIFRKNNAPIFGLQSYDFFLAIARVIKGCVLARFSQKKERHFACRSIPQMRILVNGMFGRNYRFVEVNVALFVNKTINLAFGSGEGFDFILLFDKLLQPIQIMILQKLLHRSPVFDIDALTF